MSSRLFEEVLLESEIDLFLKELSSPIKKKFLYYKQGENND